jgi:hypothetical protein
VHCRKGENRNLICKSEPKDLNDDFETVQVNEADMAEDKVKSYCNEPKEHI